MANVKIVVSCFKNRVPTIISKQGVDHQNSTRIAGVVIGTQNRYLHRTTTACDTGIKFVVYGYKNYYSYKG